VEPPWEKYPEIEAGSIGWRMGGGEEYYNAFYRWFSALTSSDQEQFRLNHPETAAWAGFYNTIARHPWTD
jgi:hypothetical protein